MTAPLSITIVLVAAMSLTACAPATLAASGSTTRALLASQIVPAQPRAAGGSDAGAAVAAHANYLRSYTTPAAQADSPSFGGRK